MKPYLYICGLSNGNGVHWVKPVFGDNRSDAIIEYIDAIKNDKRLDFDEENNTYGVVFIDISKDMFDGISKDNLFYSKF